MPFARVGRLVAVLAVAAALVGCAHPISMTAETAPERVESRLIPTKVAYALSDTERGKQVITPGGGGDKVSYYPYRDLEKSIRDALRAVYQDVVVVKSATDAEGIKAAGADIVVHLGDAADDVEVRAGHRAREDASILDIVGPARAVVADQTVVRVAQLHLGDRGVIPLDHLRA